MLIKSCNKLVTNMRDQKKINKIFEMINMILWKLFDHKTHKEAGQK